MNFVFTCLLLAVLFAVADHFAGGGLWWNDLKGKLHGRPLYWGGLLVIAVLLIDGYLNGWQWRLALVGVAWVIYRSFAWSLFGGAVNPKTVKQDVGLFARHMLVLLPVAAAAVGGMAWPNMLLLSPVYALVCLGLGLWVTKAATPGRGPNGVVVSGTDVIGSTELIRGAAFGALFATAFLPRLF